MQGNKLKGSLETTEHYARIALVVELLGGATMLPKREVEKLFDSRTRYGVTARAGAEPGCPLSAEDMGGPEKFIVTRDELVGLVNEALRARGIS
jgi:L-fuculose-phosphate aldolase